MTNINVIQLRKICDLLIAEGKGNKKVLVSDDDELNGIHCLWGFANDGDDFTDYITGDTKDYIVLS